MPARKITEQQFRTRRKDRRMVWVDAAALVIGLLVLTVSVGGIIVIEPEPEPFEWEYSFFEGRITKKICHGNIGLGGEGCVLITPRPQMEGNTKQAPLDRITHANVTQAIFTLFWSDDTGETLDDKEKKKRKWVYDENSTDILRLEVTTPWGETVVREAANDVETKVGSIVIIFDILPVPEKGKIKAFSVAEAQAELMPRYTVSDHQALGEWKAEVTMVRAGDQEGTAPADACSDLPPEVVGPMPPEVRRECDLMKYHSDLERLPDWQSTYVDTGNTWILDVTIRTYQTTVSI